nr:6346_t:CDS:2 [Entrophospora candida]
MSTRERIEEALFLNLFQEITELDEFDESKKIMRFKKGTPEEVVNKVEEQIKAQGGQITGRTKLTGLTLMYTIPDNTAHSFSAESFAAASEHIEDIENDQVVTIQ